jgi:hypothetical protein
VVEIRGGREGVRERGEGAWGHGEVE